MTTVRLRRLCLFTFCVAFGALAGSAQQPKTLLATPTTVAWGYYWSQAKPVLTIGSGETVVVQTLSTCGPPDRLEARGIAHTDIPNYVREIYDRVPQSERGPGGHILTGPIAIEGAEIGDVLEVRIKKVTSMSRGHAMEPGRTGFSRRTSPRASQKLCVSI